MTRTEARELLMQAIFQMDAQQDHSEELLLLFIKEKKPGVKQGKYIKESFREINDYISDIDTIINKYATNWKTNRMARTDVAVLRVASYEIHHSEDIPDAVIINEAVNMAKKFGGADSHKYINGILGNVARNKEADKAELIRIAEEKVIAEKLEAERLVAEKLELERLAAEKLELNRLAAEKLAEETKLAEAAKLVEEAKLAKTEEETTEETTTVEAESNTTEETVIEVVEETTEEITTDVSVDNE